MVTKNGDAIGNSATYLIAKDGSWTDWCVATQIPEKYIKEAEKMNSELIKYSDRDIDKIWKTIAK